MQIDQPYANHNGGELAFGPDGYLYIGSGDGGWEGDPLEVGQNHWEEIDFQAADSQGGENYGWDFLMGSRCFPIQAESCTAVGVLPVAEYSHDVGMAVVGIGVYRGQEFSELQGIYFAGDYGSGRIWGLARDDEDNWVFKELLNTGLHLTGSGRDEASNLFVTSCECQYGGPSPSENPPGSLWQLVAADQVPEDAEVAPTVTPEE